MNSAMFSKGKKGQWLVLLLSMLLLVSSLRPAEADAIGIPVHSSADSIVSSASTDDWPWPWKAKIAIVIDRLGNGLDGTEEALALRIPITVAIIPGSATTTRDARIAAERGKQILLAMASDQRIYGRTGSLGSSSSSLNKKRLQSVLDAHADEMPGIVGISGDPRFSIHRNERVLDAVMGFAKRNELFFFNRSPRYQSVIRDRGEAFGVPVVHGFFEIDDYYDVSYIKQKLRKAVYTAHDNGYSIVIGRAGIQGKLTIKAIEESIPMFIHHRVKPVFLSEIVADLKKQ